MFLRHGAARDLEARPGLGVQRSVLGPADQDGELRWELGIEYMGEGGELTEGSCCDFVIYIKLHCMALGRRSRRGGLISASSAFNVLGRSYAAGIREHY